MKDRKQGLIIVISAAFSFISFIGALALIFHNRGQLKEFMQLSAMILIGAMVSIVFFRVIAELRRKTVKTHCSSSFVCCPDYKSGECKFTGECMYKVTEETYWKLKLRKKREHNEA